MTLKNYQNIIFLYEYIIVLILSYCTWYTFNSTRIYLIVIDGIINCVYQYSLTIISYGIMK